MQEQRRNTPHTLVLVLQYRGTEGIGWQRQRGRDSWQGFLERALARIEGNPIRVQGASRTDAGVHARMQVAKAEVYRTLSPERWAKALNHLLPPAMAVQWAGFSLQAFSPRRLCTPKLYAYRFYFSPSRNPFLDPWALWVPERVCFDPVPHLLQRFLKVQDFSAARKKRANPWAPTSRPLTRLTFAERNGVHTLWIEGKSFLTHEVRILAGTLLEVCLGRKTLNEVVEALVQGDRGGLGKTLPARGLTLEWLHIPEFPWLDPWPTSHPGAALKHREELPWIPGGSKAEGGNEENPPEPCPNP